MKLHHAAASPFVREVMVLAYEHALADRIELVPTSVSPVQANDALAPENPLMKVPSLVTDDEQTAVRFASHLRPQAVPAGYEGDPAAGELSRITR